LISQPAKRRYRSKEERRQIVEETLQPGASVAVIARQHGVNGNQVFHWRKLYREGRLELGPAEVQLVPVRISDVMSGEPASTKFYAGVIVVEIGRARIRVEGAVERWTPTACGSSWSGWADDFIAQRHAHLDCRRRHRPAARRSGQAVVLGWRRTLFYSPSVWNEAVSFGRRPKRARYR
jgi:transposase